MLNRETSRVTGEEDFDANAVILELDIKKLQRKIDQAKGQRDSIERNRDRDAASLAVSYTDNLDRVIAQFEEEKKRLEGRRRNGGEAVSE